LAAFAVALERPGLCFVMYALSFVCDELDGRFARMLDQSSTFGAVLDMVTDRVGTSCLLATLCVLYPAYHPAFLSLLMLDIFSHWFQMYATLALGSSTHKASLSIAMPRCCTCSLIETQFAMCRTATAIAY
jgi:CDP-diacylglycerol--inositol 3-phosphatidyltransferase